MHRSFDAFACTFRILCHNVIVFCDFEKSHADVDLRIAVVAFSASDWDTVVSFPGLASAGIYRLQSDEID